MAGRISRVFHWLCGATFCAALLGCTEPGATVGPTARPTTSAPAPSERPATQRSQESRSASIYYRGVERKLLAQGLLRQDSGTDAAFGPADLARNFERIALFNEHVQVAGRFVPQQSSAPLRRWAQAVRVQMHFGEGVSPDMRTADRDFVRRYLSRLSALTGHPISLTNQGGNYHIFVQYIDEQRTLGPRIAAVEPSLSRSILREMETLPRNTYCAVYASSTVAAPHTYVSAIALIRAEHPRLMRHACYHEEIAQGLGLANDSPAARPSIFNDDEEFALLTRQDALMLRMLYDRRLRPGMTATQARPIIQQMANSLVSGPT